MAEGWVHGGLGQRESLSCPYSSTVSCLVLVDGKALLSKYVNLKVIQYIIIYI